MGLSVYQLVVVFLFSLLLVFGFLGISRVLQNVDAQAADGSWEVFTFIWNERTNLWARSSCKLRIDTLVDSIVSPTATRGFDGCSNAHTGDHHSGIGNKLLYYHDSDPDGGTTYGKIVGTAYSPVFGDIRFSESSFPDGESCYGFSGAARQPRIKKEGNIIKVKGCAYVPLLRDYILLYPEYGPGRPPAGVPTDYGAPSAWRGVLVETEESPNISLRSNQVGVNVNIASPYLKLSRCAWSSKNGYWSFGYDDTRNIGCLDDDLETELARRLDLDLLQLGSSGSEVIPAIGGSRGAPTFSSSVTKARLGQRVQYDDVKCPTGHRSAAVTLNFSENDSMELPGLLNNSLSFIFLRPFLSILLQCTDLANIFGDTLELSGPGLSADLIAHPNLGLSSSVLTSPGFTFLRGAIQNRVTGTGLGTNPKCELSDSTGNNIFDPSSSSTPSSDGSTNIESFRLINERTSIDDEPIFVFRDTELVLQCSYTNSSGDDEIIPRSVFPVKVLPSKLLERLIDNTVSVDSPTVRAGGTRIVIPIPSGTEADVVTISFVDSRNDNAHFVDTTENSWNISIVSGASTIPTITPGLDKDGSVTARRGGTIRIPTDSALVRQPSTSEITKIFFVEAKTNDGASSGRKCWALLQSNVLRELCK